jgi:hypothetical protein
MFTTNLAERQTSTATLQGTIAYDSDSRRYSIDGTWQCPWSKTFPPQKFGLMRNLRDGEEGPQAENASINGTFDGYCVVTTRSLDAKGEPLYRDRLVFERGVQLEFKKSPQGVNANKAITKSLCVCGSGTNKFGAFVIHGTAKPCTSGDNNNNLYKIILQKQYLREPSTNHQNEASHVPTRTTRTTRSNSIHGKGTIVRKRFENGSYYEGEVVNYDPISKSYKIKYAHGDFEDFDETDMKRYYKHLQKYSHAHYSSTRFSVPEKKLLYTSFM